MKKGHGICSSGSCTNEVQYPYRICTNCRQAARDYYRAHYLPKKKAEAVLFRELLSTLEEVVADLEKDGHMALVHLDKARAVITKAYTILNLSK